MDHRRGKVKRSTGSHSRSASFPSRLPSSSPSSSCSAPSRRSLICRVPPKASPTSVPRVASGGAGGLPVTVEALLRDRATQKPLLCRWAACFFRALRSRPFWFLSATKPGKCQRRGIYTHTRQRIIVTGNDAVGSLPFSDLYEGLFILQLSTHKLRLLCKAYQLTLYLPAAVSINCIAISASKSTGEEG